MFSPEITDQGHILYSGLPRGGMGLSKAAGGILGSFSQKEKNFCLASCILWSILVNRGTLVITSASGLIQPFSTGKPRVGPCLCVGLGDRLDMKAQKESGYRKRNGNDLK